MSSVFFVVVVFALIIFVEVVFTVVVFAVVVFVVVIIIRKEVSTLHPIQNPGGWNKQSENPKNFAKNLAYG